MLWKMWLKLVWEDVIGHGGPAQFGKARMIMLRGQCHHISSPSFPECLCVEYLTAISNVARLKLLSLLLAPKFTLVLIFKLLFNMWFYSLILICLFIYLLSSLFWTFEFNFAIDCRCWSMTCVHLILYLLRITCESNCSCWC